MKNDRIVVKLRETITSLKNHIKDLENELSTLSQENESLKERNKKMKDEIDKLRLIHDTILEEYNQGMAEMKDIIQQSNQIIMDSKKEKKAYENKMKLLLKRLNNQT